MRYAKWIFVAVGALGVLCLSDSSAWAKNTGDAPGECMVKNPGAGSIALRGTVAVHNVPGDTASIDVLARLERGSALKHFRVHLSPPGGFVSLTNSKIACTIFNPGETNDPATQAAVGQFVNEILAYFGLTGRTLKITDTSISDAEPDPGTNPIPYIPGGNPNTDPSGSMGDITLYAQ